MAGPRPFLKFFFPSTLAFVLEKARRGSGPGFFSIHWSGGGRWQNFTTCFSPPQVMGVRGEFNLRHVAGILWTQRDVRSRLCAT